MRKNLCAPAMQIIIIFDLLQFKLIMEKLKLLIKGFISNLVFTSLLFICAGRVNYVQGWIFLTANLFSTLMNFFTIREDNELLRERAKPGKGIKWWDKLLLSASAVIYLVIIILAGFDSGRYNWSSDFNLTLSISGVFLMICGQVLFLSARSQNNFFSSVVRIQKERGHTVCETGIYKMVRHPGYLGMALSLMGLPLITTSSWSVIPTLFAVTLLVIRTSLEDKTLTTELEGYAQYKRKTRYKLIPLLW